MSSNDSHQFWIKQNVLSQETRVTGKSHKYWTWHNKKRLDTYTIWGPIFKKINISNATPSLSLRRGLGEGPWSGSRDQVAPCTTWGTQEGKWGSAANLYATRDGLIATALLFPCQSLLAVTFLGFLPTLWNQGKAGQSKIFPNMFYSFFKGNIGTPAKQPRKSEPRERKRSFLPPLLIWLLPRKSLGLRAVALPNCLYFSLICLYQQETRVLNGLEGMKSNWANLSLLLS